MQDVSEYMSMWESIESSGYVVRAEPGNSEKIVNIVFSTFFGTMYFTGRERAGCDNFLNDAITESNNWRFFGEELNLYKRVAMKKVDDDIS